MKISRKPKLIIFDFDGCIANSTSFAIDCLYKAFRGHHINVNKENIIRSLQGNFEDSMVSLSKINKEVKELSKSIYNEIKESNYNFLQDQIYTEIYSIIMSLIPQLYHDKVKLAILSRSKRNRIISNLKHCNLLKFFDESLIIGEGDPYNLNPKPSPEGVLKIIELANIKDNSEVIFVGDHEYDYKAAESAGISFLGSGWSKYLLLKSKVLVVENMFDFWSLGLVSTISPDIIGLQRLLISKKLTILIGAGFSLEAGFEDWKTLVNKILKEDFPEIMEGSLPQLIQTYINNNLALGKLTILEYLNKSLTNYTNIPRKHISLSKLGLDRIWTTNFDSLLEEAFTNCQLITDDHELTPRGERTQIIKINGSINSKLADIILSQRSFEKIYEDRKEIIKELKAELCSRSCLFLGCSFEDPLLKNILGEHANIIEKREVPIHYTFTIKKKNLKQYGIKEILIPAWKSIEDILSELEWRSRNHSIVISGICVGREHSLNEIEFLRNIGSFLVEAGFRIKIGNGIGVVENIISGAKKWCDLTGNSHLHRERIRRYNRVLYKNDFIDKKNNLATGALKRLERIITPIGTLIFVNTSPGLKDRYNDMRREMFSNADACISIGGYASKNDLNIKYETIEKGMLMERDLAYNHNIPYIPIPYIEGIGKNIYNEMLLTDFEIFKNERIKYLLKTLKDIKDPYIAARITVACAIIACIL